jgi:hypothetical protein
MTHDTKHGIFISTKRGGYGLQNFTREYRGALLHNIEVYITNDGSIPAHALITSIEEAIKQRLWTLLKDGKIPRYLACYTRINQWNISGKKALTYHDTFDRPTEEIISFDHTHLMHHAITSTSALGFMLRLRDLNNEFAARFADELLLFDKKA